MQGMERRNWIGYAVALVLCGLTHPITLFLLFSHACFALLQHNKQVLIRFVVTCVVVGLVLLPLVVRNTEKGESSSSRSPSVG